MLLVDDRETEFGEINVFRKQRMGAHDGTQLARAQLVEDVVARAAFERSDDQRALAAHWESQPLILLNCCAARTR